MKVSPRSGGLPVELRASAELGALCKEFSADDWFHRGFSLTRSSLSEGLVADLRRRVEGVVRGEFDRERPPLRYSPPVGCSQSHIEMYSHVHWSDSLISAVAMDKSLARLAATLLRTNRIRLWGTSVIYKYGSLDAVNDVVWHRDMTFWQCVNSPRMLTFWIALDDTFLENGCMEFAMGSHSTPFRGDDTDLCTFPRFIASMRHGQISTHHCLTGHRSNSNRTEHPRRALTIHLMDGDLRYVPNTPSDDHMNVCLLGKTTDAAIAGEYFPILYETP